MLEVKNLGKFYEFKKHWYLKKEKHLIFENINFSLKENEKFDDFRAKWRRKKHFS